MHNEKIVAEVIYIYITNYFLYIIITPNQIHLQQNLKYKTYKQKW